MPRTEKEKRINKKNITSVDMVISGMK